MPETERLLVQRLVNADLTADVIDEIWRCHSRSGKRTRDAFARALQPADEIFVGREGNDGAVRGFTANKILTLEWAGRSITVVYTLFASVDPEWRGSNLLQRIFLRRFLALKAKRPLRPLYWVFTASTYLSYLGLPRNFVEYWPSRHRATPANARALMDIVMRRVGIEGWDPASGVVRRNGTTNYSEGVVSGDSCVITDPDIQFYAACNPGQKHGDTLVCLCRFDARNAGQVLLKAIRRLYQWRRSAAPTADVRRTGAFQPGSRCGTSTTPVLSR